MNSLSQLRKLLAALVLAGMAALMLACSSTDEETTSSGSAPPPESADACIEQCAEGDLQCKEACIQNLNI